MKTPLKDYSTLTPTELHILQKLQSKQPYSYDSAAESTTSFTKKARIFIKDLFVHDFDKKAWYEKKGEKVVKQIYTKLYIQKSSRKISEPERCYIHKIFKKIHFETPSFSVDEFHKKLTACLKILEAHPEMASPKINLQEKTISSLISFEEAHPNSILMDDKLLAILNGYNKEDIKNILEYAYQLEETTKLPKDVITKGITSFFQGNPHKDLNYKKNEALHQAILKAFLETCTKEECTAIEFLRTYKYPDTRALLEDFQTHPFWIYLSIDDADFIKKEISKLLQSKDLNLEHLKKLEKRIQKLALKTGLDLSLAIKALDIFYRTSKTKIDCAYTVYFEDVLTKCPDSKKEQLRLLSSCCKELICTSIETSENVFPPCFTWMLTLAQGLPDEILAKMSLENIEPKQYFQDLFTTYQKLSIEHTPDTIARSMAEKFSTSIKDASNEDIVKEECLEEKNLFSSVRSEEERELVTQFRKQIEKISFLVVAEEVADEQLTQEAIRLAVFLKRKGFDDRICLHVIKRIFSVERNSTEPIEKKIASLQQRVVSLPFFSIQTEQVTLEEIENRVQEKPLELLSDLIKGIIKGFCFHDEKTQNEAVQEIEQGIQKLEKTISTKENTVVSQDEKSVLALTLTHLLQILTINHNNISFLSDTIDLAHEYVHILATEGEQKIASEKQIALLTTLSNFEFTEENLRKPLQLIRETFFEDSVKGKLFELLMNTTKEAFLKKNISKKILKEDTSPYTVKKVERLIELLLLIAPVLLTVVEQAIPHILLNSEKYKEALKLIQDELTSHPSNFPFLIIDKLLPIAKPFLIQIFHYGLLGIIDPQYTELPETIVEASPLSLPLIVKKCCAKPIEVFSEFLTATVNALGVKFSSKSLQQFQAHCPIITSKIKCFLMEKSLSVSFKRKFAAFSIYLKDAFRAKGFSPFLENIFSVIEEKLTSIVAITKNEPLKKTDMFEKTISNIAQTIIDPSTPADTPAIQRIRPYIQMLPKMANKLATFQTISRKKGFISSIEAGIQLIEATVTTEDNFFFSLPKKIFAFGIRLATGKSSKDLIKGGIQKYITAPLKLTEEESKELTDGLFNMLPVLLPLLKIVPELLKKHALDDILTDIQFLGSVVSGEEKVERNVLEHRIADLLLKIVKEVNDIERFAIEEGLFAVAKKVIEMSQQTTTSS